MQRDRHGTARRAFSFRNLFIYLQQRCYWKSPFWICCFIIWLFEAYKHSVLVASRLLPCYDKLFFFRVNASCTILFLSFQSFCVMPFKKSDIGIFLFYFISKELNEIWCLYNSHWIFQTISFLYFLVKYIGRRL